MKFSVLTPLVPYPPNDGDKLRLYNFLLHLKKKGHQMDLMCLTRVKEDLAQVEASGPFAEASI